MRDSEVKRVVQSVKRGSTMDERQISGVLAYVADKLDNIEKLARAAANR